jgi:hypothetical protein
MSCAHAVGTNQIIIYHLSSDDMITILQPPGCTSIASMLLASGQYILLNGACLKVVLR